MKFLSLSLALLAGCGEPRVETDDGTPDDTDDTDAAIPVEATELAWRLHAEVEALVYVTWTQSDSASAAVEYSFDEGIWLTSPTFAGAAGANEQILVGIPYATEAQWRVVLDGRAAADGEPLVTGELPDVPIGVVTVSDPSAWQPGDRYLLTSINRRSGGWTGGEYWTFIIDRQGRVVWAHAAPDRHWTLYAQVAVTGDYFLWDDATYWSDWDDGAGSTIHKAWLDAEIEQIATPGLHHAFVQLPDETLVWGSQYHGGGEALVERALNGTGETVLWTCEENWPGSGECESNGIFYVEERDTFLYSFYTNNSLLELDRATGTSLWWAGEVGNGYAFDPPDSQFSWQHGISYTDAGTLLVSSEHVAEDGEGRETWLLEYDVDADGRALRLAWGNSSGTFAPTNGDAWRLDNGDTLHVVGAAGVIREVDPDGNDVWRVEYEGQRLLGRVEFIDDLYALVTPRE